MRLPITPRLARSIEGVYLKLHRFFYQEINKGWESGFSDLNISNFYMADYGDDVKKIVSDAKAKSKD